MSEASRIYAVAKGTQSIPLLPINGRTVKDGALADVYQEYDDESYSESDDVIGLALRQSQAEVDDDLHLSRMPSAIPQQKGDLPSLPHHSYNSNAPRNKVPSPRTVAKPSPRWPAIDLVDFTSFLSNVLSRYKQQSQQHRAQSIPSLEPLPPAPTPALEQQQRLERIWQILKVPIVDRLDMILTLGSDKDQTAMRFGHGLTLWERAAALVRARERAVQHLEEAEDKLKEDIQRAESSSSTSGQATVWGRGAAQSCRPPVKY